MKTSELTGKALNWAVHQARFEGACHDEPFPSYSTDWAQGGPIIEREGIGIVQQGDAADWVASVYNHNQDDWHLHTAGPTPLIAAMRCYVASKLGDEVEVPDELL
jgi:hypothetical protein